MSKTGNTLNEAPLKNPHSIDTLFDILDKWRHFPNYQLERRADIFFALFMKEILAVKGITDIECIIPEFPVRLGDIYDDTDSNRSCKIDYLVLTPEKIYLVELKTDNKSRRLEQDDYLRRAQQIGFIGLLEGLLTIYNATTATGKYQHLLNELCAHGCLECVGGALYSLLEDSDDDSECEIVYVMPTRPKERLQQPEEALCHAEPRRSMSNTAKDTIITFQEIVEQADFGGEIGGRFKESLEKWGSVKAGDV